MKRSQIFSLLLAVFVMMIPLVAIASETDGTIDATYKYAWGENIGWINFGTSNGDVHITDSGLSGYALSENAGWINLGAVVNDGEGNLSGYAWGENVGYIKFDPTNGGVIINSSGEFTGSALGENIGWIIFDGDYNVKTDWRPSSSRVVAVERQGSASGRRNATSAASALSLSAASSENQSALSSIIEKAVSLVNIFSFLKSKPEETIIPADIAAKEKSDTLSGKWSLLPEGGINQFLFASLPPEIQNLVKKFPELAKTFKETGITKISDLQKLKNAKFVLPGIGEEVGIAGGISIPLNELSSKQKLLLPSEIVYAKSGPIDYSIYLSVTEEGLPEQKITTIVGKPIDLAIKEDKPINGIKGYLAVRNLDRQQAKSKSLPVSSLLASPMIAIMAVLDSPKTEIKEEMILSRFNYSDEDKDGIYTASITSPLVHGEYEIISIIDYKDPALGKKELRLVTVVDPEGYVYRKSGNEEARVLNATISLFVKNNGTDKFELWPAKNYRQINPQKTDKSGSYSFLVPEGVYKMNVSAENYYDYKGAEFVVKEGRNVHQNIEMKPKSWWRSLFNLFR